MTDEKLTVVHAILADTSKYAAEGEKLPKLEEIYEVLDRTVCELYNGDISSPISPHEAWVFDNAEKVIANWDEFSEWYIKELYKEYQRLFDKEKNGEV